MKMSVTLRQHFWKTKLCPLHMENRCNEGSNCDYAHSIEDLRSIPDLKRTKLCYKLLKGEKCFNKKCNYAHNQDELKSAQNLFAYKSSMCKFVANKRCLNGATCRFAHSVDELRIPRIPDILLEKKDNNQTDGGNKDFLNIGINNNNNNMLNELNNSHKKTRNRNNFNNNLDMLINNFNEMHIINNEYMKNYNNSLNIHNKGENSYDNIINMNNYNENGNAFVDHVNDHFCDKIFNSHLDNNMNIHINNKINNNMNNNMNNHMNNHINNNINNNMNNHINNNMNNYINSNMNNHYSNCSYGTYDNRFIQKNCEIKYQDDMKKKEKNKYKNKGKLLKEETNSPNYIDKQNNSSTEKNKKSKNSCIMNSTSSSLKNNEDKSYDSNTTISSSLNYVDEDKNKTNEDTYASPTFEKVDKNQYYAKTEETISMNNMDKSCNKDDSKEEKKKLEIRKNEKLNIKDIYYENKNIYIHDSNKHNNNNNNNNMNNIKDKKKKNNILTNKIKEEQNKINNVEYENYTNSCLYKKININQNIPNYYNYPNYHSYPIYENCPNIYNYPNIHNYHNFQNISNIKGYSPYFNYIQTNDKISKADTCVDSPYSQYINPNEYYFYDHQNNIQYVPPNYYGNYLYYYAAPYGYGPIGLPEKVVHNNPPNEKIIFNDNTGKEYTTNEEISIKEVETEIEEDKSDDGNNKVEDSDEVDSVLPKYEECTTEQKIYENNICEEMKHEFDTYEKKVLQVVTEEDNINEKDTSVIKNYKNVNEICNMEENIKGEDSQICSLDDIKKEHSVKNNENYYVRTNVHENVKTSSIQNFMNEKISNKHISLNIEDPKRKNKNEKQTNEEVQISSNILHKNEEEIKTKDMKYYHKENKVKRKKKISKLISSKDSKKKNNRNNNIMQNGKNTKLNPVPSSVYSYIGNTINSQGLNYDTTYMKPLSNDMDIYMNNLYHINPLNNDYINYNLNNRNYGYYYCSYPNPSIFNDEAYLN
ncbi:zinc finger protein, putative [Plasmodium gaboni]|uniref:Zinc finger protein, putative n=1 Tax=Plasmodium gaboni TaxID=647221 RepID=A0ABY1USM7_9APIC|nr:zinc finger protein, putative [Plasmodium gaboni]